MKELPIEQKAKAYDEVVKRAKIEKEKSRNLGLLEFIDKNFPELAEPEDAIMVKFIKNQLFNIKKTITDNYELDAKLTKAIDWLEKQDKTTPTEDELEALRIAAYEPVKNWSEKLQSLYEKLAHCERGEQNMK